MRLLQHFLASSTLVHGLTLLRGGTFITYSDEKADLEIITDGSMLFNDTILAISTAPTGLDSHMGAEGIEVVNTTGKIISPGFIDTHRHTWQTAMRTLGPNVQLSSYFWTFSSSGPAALILSPEDIHVSNLMGTLEGLNAGTTTALDYSHMTWSRAHANAALQGAIESGGRVYFAYEVAPVTVAPSPHPVTVNTSAQEDQIAHIQELAKQSPFNGGLVTLGVAYDGFALGNPMDTTIFEVARNASLPLLTTHDVGGVFRGTNAITTINALPLDPPALNSSFAIVFAHCSDIDSSSADLLRQFNKHVSITPESEMHYGHGHPHSHLIQDQGSLGTDTFFTYSIDMVTQMRIWLQATREKLYQVELDQFFVPLGTPMSVKQAFLLGTRNGGLALGRPDLGVLREGAKADVLILSTDAIGLIGWSDPVAAVVLHSNVRDIEEIYVDGKLVKSGGKLISFDWQGKGFDKKLEDVAKKFKEGLENSDLDAWEDGLLGNLGIKKDDLRPPFQVDVTRGNGTGL